MSSITDTLFGGTDKSAQRAQKKANEAATALIAENAEQARADAMSLFPASDTNRNLGFQAALDVMAQAAPQQLSAFQQGNLGAQAALLGGLPQMQNAILGLPANLNAIQPQAIQYDTSFFNQQLPEFALSGDVVGQDEEPINPLAGTAIRARAFNRSRGPTGSAGASMYRHGGKGPGYRYFGPDAPKGGMRIYKDDM